MSSPSPRLLRLAIVGLGNMGRVHAARIAASPRCELAATVDPVAEGARYRTVEALLADPHQSPLDGAIVATPNHLHAETAEALLQAGVPVLVEKPVAENLESAQRLIRAARSASAPTLIGHHRRHSAAIRAAQACLAANTLGRIVTVQAATLFHKPDPYFETAWRRAPRSGGPVLINLIHDLDSLRALAGEIAAVQAIASNRIRQFEVEDTAAILIEFASGALGTILLSDTAVSPHSWEQTSGENPIYPRDATQDCIVIAGTQGSLAVPTMRLWRHEAGAAPSWTQPLVTSRLPLDGIDPLARQLDHFCDVIERRSPPLVTAEDAARSLSAALAVRQAAQTGTRIALTG